MAIERYLVKDYHYNGIDYPIGLRKIPDELGRLIDIDMENNTPLLLTVDERTFDTSKVDPELIVEASIKSDVPALTELETPVVKPSVKQTREQKAKVVEDGSTGQV